ncbi:MAG: eL32 family ribosomal protein [Nanoarchaeota archaeon]
MISKKKPTFLRSDTVRHKKLGSHNRRMQKWRRPRGKHSKIRRHRFGYTPMVSIGYGSYRKTAGLIDGLKPLLVFNSSDVEKAPKDSILIIARVGARKKLDIIKKAEEKGFKLLNVNKEIKK